MGAARGSDGGRALLLLLLLALHLLQQGREVQAGALQLAVGPTGHHVTLRVTQVVQFSLVYRYYRLTGGSLCFK